MIQKTLQKLQELQEILADKYSVEHELKELPKALNTKTELVNRLNQSHKEKQERLKSGQAKVGEFRIKMADAEQERERCEENMGAITTQRGYEALIKEIQLATEKEQDFRRDLQREEKYITELQQNIENETALIKEQTKELKEEQQKIKKEIAKRSTLLKDLTDKEEAVIPGMDEEMIFKFRRIIRSKGGQGIVSLRRSVCSGCNMILPAQFVNEVRAEDAVHFCPYCSMILYHQSESGEEGGDFDEDASFFEDDDDLDDDFDDDFDDEQNKGLDDNLSDDFHKDDDIDSADVDNNDDDGDEEEEEEDNLDDDDVDEPDIDEEEDLSEE